MPNVDDFFRSVNDLNALKCETMGHIEHQIFNEFNGIHMMILFKIQEYDNVTIYI
jgi:hypothetical protein